MRPHLFVRRAAGIALTGVAHPIVGRHVVDVVAAVKVVEALLCGQIFAVIAEVPLADQIGVVARRLQHFGKRDLISQDAVDVVQELIGTEKVRRRPRVAVDDCREDDVVEIAARRVSARQHGKARRRTHRRRRVKVVHHHAVFGNGIDVGGVDRRRLFGILVAVRRDVGIRHIVHQYHEHVGRALAAGGDGIEIGVMPVPHPLDGRTSAQTHEHRIDERCRKHENYQHGYEKFCNAFRRKLLYDGDRCGQRDRKKAQHEVPPQPPAEAVRAPYEKVQKYACIDGKERRKQKDAYIAPLERAHKHRERVDKRKHQRRKRQKVETAREKHKRKHRVYAQQDKACHVVSDRRLDGLRSARARRVVAHFIVFHNFLLCSY